VAVSRIALDALFGIQVVASTQLPFVYGTPNGYSSQYCGVIGRSCNAAGWRRLERRDDPPRKDIHGLTASVVETGLVACPKCDLLHKEPAMAENCTLSCVRCGAVLAAPRRDAFTRVLVLALTAMILMIAAVYFPFLDLKVAGLNNHTSVLDAILAFSSGLLLPLSFAVAALIVLIPSIRFAAIAYTLWPLVLRRRPFRYARTVFRLAETLRPWAMAEIFIVGVAVALVKVAGLATISVGPAFWAFCALVIVAALHDNFMCRRTIWKSLEQSRQ